jgi:hypothetical protein
VIRHVILSRPSRHYGIYVNCSIRYEPDTIIAGRTKTREMSAASSMVCASDDDDAPGALQPTYAGAVGKPLRGTIMY